MTTTCPGAEPGWGPHGITGRGKKITAINCSNEKRPFLKQQSANLLKKIRMKKALKPKGSAVSREDHKGHE